MKCDLRGLALNAAAALERLAREARRRENYDPESEDDDPAGQADLHAFVLRELAENVKETREGKHTVAEFADYYCLERK